MRTPGLFNEELRRSDMIAISQELTSAMANYQILRNYPVRDSSKAPSWNLYADTQKLLDEERILPTNRGFRLVDNKKLCSVEKKMFGLL